MKFNLIIASLIAAALTSCNPEKYQKIKIDQSSNSDSIFLASTLDKAVTLAATFAKTDTTLSFQEVNTNPSDSFSYSIDVRIKLLKTLPEYQHLLIERSTPHNVFTDVFVVQEGTVKKVVNSELPNLTHIRDTLYDVNGDNLKDLLIHWYPMSGCCRRNKYDVYLAQHDGTFSKPYSFINPTFFSKEKTIRGVLYGHQESVGLYKYKWNEAKVDTIEYLYKNKDKVGSYIRIRKMYLPQVQEKDKVYINSLPEEYKNIEDIDWFNGN